MPTLFDLLSDNTDDKTIDSLRRIAKQKRPGDKPPKANQEKRPTDDKGSLSRAILDKLDFVALDLETTGLDSKNDRVMEIGAVKYLGGKLIEVYSTFINPTTTIPAQITSLTGINNDHVKDAPLFADVARKLLEFLGDLPLCGHQIEFDINFLNEEYKRAGLPKVFMKQIDTALLARIVLPCLTRYTLGFVAKTVSVQLTNAHRALDDARASGNVALVLIPKLTEMPLSVRSVMAQCAPPSLIKTVLQSSLLGEKYRLELTPLAVFKPGKRLVGKEETEILDVEDIRAMFVDKGALSAVLQGYKQRSSQTDMAACVAEAFSTQTTLVAEAGTGTGKSLAYLIPAALFAVKNDCRVLISTHTRNLQDQLVSKDLPVVNILCGNKLTFSVLKGRGNYLCQKRYRLLLNGELGDFSYRERMGILPLVRWAQETTTGDIEEQNQFNIKWFARIWHSINADAHTCEGKRCRYCSSCFLQAARQRALSSNVVVINHALFFSELCASSSFLGKIGPVVFDEAHHLESCGHRHLRTEIDTNRCNTFMEKVMNCGKEVAKCETKNPLCGISELEYKPIVKRLRKEIKSFLDDCVAWGKNKTHAHAEFQTDYGTDDFSANVNGLALETSVADLQDVLRGFSQAFEAIDKKDNDSLLSSEIVSLSEAASQLKADLSYLVKADTEDHVFWCEGNAAKGWIKLCGVPLDVGGLLASIWEQNSSGRVFTSATLSVSGSMAYFRRKVGLIDAMDAFTRCETFASPFSSSQALRCGTKNSPELDSPEYPAYVADTVHKLLTTLNKNILVLFTANTMLNAVYELLKKTTAGMECTILAQGFSGHRGAILEEFKQAQRAVLLGADSFWEGVDVPGKACEIVIIPRLPFPVPTHPLTKALCKKVEEEKGESFMSYSVPEAIIKFRQGTGRLIRTIDDKGALIVLDNRLYTKGYGKQFTNSLSGPFTEFKTQQDMMDAVTLFFNEGTVPETVMYVPLEDM